MIRHKITQFRRRERKVGTSKHYKELSSFVVIQVFLTFDRYISAVPVKFEHTGGSLIDDLFQMGGTEGEHRNRYHPD